MLLSVLPVFFLHLPCATSHTISLLATLIMGETEFPTFSIILQVNDIPVEYYDRNDKQIASRRFWATDGVIEEHSFKRHVYTDVYDNMQSMARVMMKRHNDTSGVHALQKLSTCNAESDGVRQFSSFYAYKGVENLRYDALKEIQSTSVPEFIWSKARSEAQKSLYRDVYHPFCVRTLQKYLQQDKNFLMRKVHPRVRVFQKTQADSGETQVICLATGFYPRHINLSLLRDERPVPEEHLTGGELLPNGDGTYQMRKSLRVSEEELQGKHRYTCTVTHLSPDNRLHVSWEPESTADIVIICTAVGLIVLIAAASIITAVIIYRKRKTGGDHCETWTSAGVTKTEPPREDIQTLLK